MGNKYYFSISFKFKSDYNVANLEQILNIKATKLTSLKDSKGPVPSAKFYYQTKEYDEVYTDQVFEKFVQSLSEKFNNIPEILKKENGICSICIVFTKLDEKPCLSLNANVLELLSKMNVNFDIDFI